MNRLRRCSWAVAVVASAILSVAVLNVLVLLDGGSSAADRAPTTDAECIVVLGAGVREGAPSPILEDRLAEALALHRAGRAKKVLVSGDHHTRDYDEPNTMRAWLEARGIPRSDIFMDHAGLDTYSSMWRAKHVFGVERTIVVTQRFHLPRAVWTARALGMTAIGSAADRRRYRGAAWFELREIVSRAKAFVDVASGRKPRHAGPTISFDDDGSVTEG